MLKIRMFIVISVLISALPAQSESSQYQPTKNKFNSRPHHFFNAELLSPDEKQISILGSFKVGVNDSFEIGTQGLFILGGAYNLYLKHLMFNRESWQTAFVAHSFFISNETKETDEDTLTEKKGTSELWITAMGIVTSHRVSPKTQLSWGLYDLYLSNYQTTDHLDVQGHFISPSVAIDYFLNYNWSFTGTLTYSTYINFNIESDIGDAKIDANLFQNDALGIDPILSFLTLTYRHESFNTEFGFIKLPGAVLPYLNIFWRFQ